ncbi:30S ribosomal protein S16, partial [termite gut metagenome]
KQSGLETLKAKQEEAKKNETKIRLDVEKKINEEKAKALAEKKAAEKTVSVPIETEAQEAPAATEQPESVAAE